MTEISVFNKSDSYKVYLEEDMKKVFNIVEKNYKHKKIYIITDDVVEEIWKEFIEEMKEYLRCEIYAIPNGEENKNINIVQGIYDFLIANDCDRNSILISVGGGVVGDLVGFTASTYMRGIKYINIPTTLISQVDSCIGGKVGYNYNGVKNLIGNFYNPDFVFISPRFLDTLNKEQYISGLGEVVKYALIRDEKLFDYLCENYNNILKLDKQCLFHIIERCLFIKNDVVESDFKDLGLRNMLNFGHTIGHGIEIDSAYTTLHGNAVALGMLAAIKLSEKKLNLSKDIYLKVQDLYDKLGLPTEYKVDNSELFLYSIKHDKKNINDTINCVLLEELGKCRIKVEVKDEEIIEAINHSIYRRN